MLFIFIAHGDTNIIEILLSAVLQQLELQRIIVSLQQFYFASFLVSVTTLLRYVITSQNTPNLWYLFVQGVHIFIPTADNVIKIPVDSLLHHRIIFEKKQRTV